MIKWGSWAVICFINSDALEGGTLVLHWLGRVLMIFPVRMASIDSWYVCGPLDSHLSHLSFAICMNSASSETHLRQTSPAGLIWSVIRSGGAPVAFRAHHQSLRSRILPEVSDQERFSIRDSNAVSWPKTKSKAKEFYSIFNLVKICY